MAELPVADSAITLLNDIAEEDKWKYPDKDQLPVMDLLIFAADHEAGTFGAFVTKRYEDTMDVYEDLEVGDAAMFTFDENGQYARHKLLMENFI